MFLMKVCFKMGQNRPAIYKTKINFGVAQVNLHKYSYASQMIYKPHNLYKGF